MSKMVKFLLDIFFPNTCPFCKNFIRWDFLSCNSCKENLPYVSDDICPRCGKAECICHKKINYDKAYTVCYYEGLARTGIIGLKTDNALNTAEFFANIIAKKILDNNEKFDLIVPVPSSKAKKRKRGYNQAEEFGKFIGKLINVNVSDKILFQNETNVRQHELSAEERAINAKLQFGIKNDIDLKGKKILLCDDVMTTANTINECAKLLKEIGAKS
ncbi:MAG: ComF family protein, partial [Oscillospiraceae bacterium]